MAGRGIVTVCRCGQPVVLRTSKTVTNPGRLFHGCPYGSENNPNHLFKWTDKSMLEEIEDMIPKVDELERESVALKKSVEVLESEAGTLMMETRTCEAVVCGVEKELRAFEKELQACKMEIRAFKNMVGIISNPRNLSPPINGRRIIDTPMGLSPPRNTRSFSGGGSRALSPPSNARSFSGGSRALSPGRNVGSYMGSSRGSPPPRCIEGFHGGSRMHDDVRASPYTVSSVINRQPPASGAPFPRPMLPPPVPNPHPLPPLSQLPPLGNMMQTNPFTAEEPQSVDSFLESIGLGKYSLAFKREEVDMTTVKQMKESDLKDLIIPMGPRKKILHAIACLPKR